MKLLIIAFAAASCMYAENANLGGPADSALPHWLKLGAEIRGRGEGLRGIGYLPGANDAYYLHRIRFNAAIAVSPWLRFSVQAQDSRVAGWDCNSAPASVSNPLDVRQAWVEAGVEEEPGWTVRFGRQPLVFGDMRLISTSNWGNVGPNYDGARLTYATGKARIDGFATELVNPVQDHWDHPRAIRRLHGFYASFAGPIPRATLDIYVFYKQNALAGPDVRIYTSGLRLTGKTGAHGDYTIEAARQTGHDGALLQSAWASHWEAGRTLGASGLRIAVEYNYASGDGNPHDSRRGTFDNLYPTDKYGTADGIAWRNIHEPILDAEWKPARRWKLKLAWHNFWLADRSDALYTLGGTAIAGGPDASSSRVGSEIDARAIWQQSTHFQLYGGYGYFRPGPFLRETGRQGATHCPYLMWTYSF